jgi:hypothetical protein
MTDDNRGRLRWGHGLHPVSEAVWTPRRNDAVEVMAAFDSRITPEYTDDLAGAITRMAALLREISEQSSRDWFVMSSLLSHPSPRLAARLSKGLEKLLFELDRDDIPGINTALEQLESLQFPRIVEQYLAATRPLNPAPVDPPAGWVFLLTSRSDPSLLLAGATHGTLDEAVAETNRSNPDSDAFGIAAAWRVTDPEAARAVMENEIGYRHVGNGYHSFEAWKEVREMKHDLDRELTARDLVVGNPFWKPAQPKPLLEIDPYSHDIRNRNFAVDIGSVFEAFRR